MTASRQLDQSGLECRHTVRDLAGGRHGTWWSGLDQCGSRGQRLLDQFTARALLGTPADLISLGIGINLVNSQVMRRWAFDAAVHGFLDIIRDGHPTTPLLVVSPIHCPIHEDTPGPRAVDTAVLAAGTLAFVATGDPAEKAAGKRTLATIRDDLARIVAQRARPTPTCTTSTVVNSTGRPITSRCPLPHRLHPDAATHQLMGKSVFACDGAFARQRVYDR